MRILLIDDNDPFRHFVITTLENHLRNVDVVEATSLKVAQLVYDSDPYFECVLTSLDFTTGSTLSMIHHIQNFNQNIPIITYSEHDTNEEIPHTHYISKGTSEKKSPKIFIEALFSQDVFSNNLKDKNPEKKFAQIKIFYLWRFEELPFDLYVKINEKKFVKILAKENRYDEAFIEKYNTSENQYLYLDFNDYPLLEALLYSDDWFEEMNELSEEDKNYRMKKIIQNMAYSIGLTPHLIQKAQEVVQFVVNDIGKSQSLSQIYNRQQKGMSFQANTSTLIAYLTSALCDELKWTTQSSKEKLGFAAIFQDTSLKSSKLCSLFYANIEELEQLDISKEEKKTFLEHPIRSAEIVKDINLRFPQVEDIIRHHHERPDGSGFPQGINFQKIPPLSSLFIVAHDYVMRSMVNRFEKDNNDILSEMEPEYTNGHFLKCFRALKNILNN